MKTNPAVLDQHAEETAFLWILRDNAVRAPHYDLPQLARLDSRVEAHLDGLRVAGEDGWKRALDELKHGEPGEVFAAASLATDDEARFRTVLDAAKSPELERAVVSAIGWAPSEPPALRKLLASDSPRLRRLALAGCAVRRLDPGPALDAALASSDEALRKTGRRAAELLGRVAPPRAAVDLDPATVPSLIDKMSVPASARTAGEAFTFITGADIEELKLDAPPPTGFQAGPTEDPADEKVAMDPDANLPWPDAAKVRKWWSAMGGRFAPGLRLLLGRPIDAAWAREVLRTGRQRHRAAAALELAALEPGKPVFEVRAPGFRQKRELRSFP
ncbi:MAG: hypothetical protein HYY17_06745 [Planctomycetes bacterium]|nr:hypothetical protein [Planctomycetota bacterium]